MVNPGSGERRWLAIFAVPSLRAAQFRQHRLSDAEFYPAVSIRQPGEPRVVDEINPFGAAILRSLFLKQAAHIFL